VLALIDRFADFGRTVQEFFLDRLRPGPSQSREPPARWIPPRVRRTRRHPRQQPRTPRPPPTGPPALRASRRHRPRPPRRHRNPRGRDL